MPNYGENAREFTRLRRIREQENDFVRFLGKQPQRSAPPAREDGVRLFH